MSKYLNAVMVVALLSIGLPGAATAWDRGQPDEWLAFIADLGNSSVFKWDRVTNTTTLVAPPRRSRSRLGRHSGGRLR